MKDNIKPEHYRKGEIDLYEAFSQIFPHNEYRAGMQMIAMRYMFRDKINRVEDLGKSIYTLERLKEKEIEHREKQEKVKNNKTLKELIADMGKDFGDFTSDSSQDQKDDENIRLLNSFLDSGYNYLARDENGNLWKYQSIPKRNVSFWNESSFEDAPCKIDGHDFPEVKWTDGKPTRIIDLLETYSKSEAPNAGQYLDDVYHYHDDLLKRLRSDDYDYLARDEDGDLWGFRAKPEKEDELWDTKTENRSTIIENDNFPEIKWIDAEPTRIVDLLASYENCGENGK